MSIGMMATAAISPWAVLLISLRIAHLSLFHLIPCCCTDSQQTWLNLWRTLGKCQRNT